MRRIEKIDYDKDPTAQYPLTDGKIYGYWDRSLRKVGVIKRLTHPDNEVQLWHNCILNNYKDRWNSGSNTHTGVIDSVLKWHDCEVWEFDNIGEFLEWALERVS